MNQNFKLTGAPNFRDLGGLPTTTGRKVRFHRLLRSDHLGALQADDLAALASTLGESIRVLDLRGETERQSAMCVIPGATVHSLPIEPSIVQKLSELMGAGTPPSAQETVGLMQDTYRNFVRVNTPRFSDLFGHALEQQEAPLVFHCTAGKDRTGLAAALLLLALDVDADVVMDDYLHTNVRLADRIPAGVLPPQVARVLWSVQPEFLQAAYEVIDADYGNVANYLKSGIGLGNAELERLRSLYLQVP